VGRGPSRTGEHKKTEPSVVFLLLSS